MSPSKIQIREYAKDQHGKDIDENIEYQSTNLESLIEDLQSILSQGFTSREVNVYMDYDCPFTRVKYYKVREETDKEYQRRLNAEKAREKQIKDREKAIASLTPTQRRVLGLN